MQYTVVVHIELEAEDEGEAAYQVERVLDTCPEFDDYNVWHVLVREEEEGA